MSTLTFDTLKYTERLRAAGVSEPQAKVEAEALRDVLAEALDSTLATKADIARLESSTKADIARLESSTKADIARLEASIEKMELRLTIKLGAFIAMAVGILIAVIKSSNILFICIPFLDADLSPRLHAQGPRLFARFVTANFGTHRLPASPMLCQGHTV